MVEAAYNRRLSQNYQNGNSRQNGYSNPDTNVPLENQYRGVQMDEPLTWKAFLRRIHHVVEYTAEGCNAEPVPVQEALAGFTEINNDEGLPL